MLYQIKAPHFCAGFVAEEIRVMAIVTHAAPIIRYMVGLPVVRVLEYCVKKGWKLELIEKPFAVENKEVEK